MPDNHQQQIETLLAFDFGLRRIGVAVGQTITCTASPLTTLLAEDGAPKWDEIQRLLKHWQPDALVVGLPYRLDGTEQPITHAAKRFANRLQGRFELPVHTVDERLTSVAAEGLLKQHQRRYAKADIDAMAAKIILETWMQQHIGNSAI